MADFTISPPEASLGHLIELALGDFQLHRKYTKDMALLCEAQYKWSGTPQEKKNWDAVQWTSDYAVIYDNPYGAPFVCLFECDGYQWHSEKSAFERDRKKDREAAAGGMMVARFAAVEILQSPDYVVREIGLILAAFDSHLVYFKQGIEAWQARASA